MSEIFEGILCRTSVDEVAVTLGSQESPLALGTAQLDEELAVVYRNDPRREGQFSVELEDIAATLSSSFGQALLVRYDSRIGHRSSKYYVEGEPVRELGHGDEVYVLLDEEGEPLLAGERFGIDQLDPDKEYETLKNAIEMGLDALGAGEWSALLEFMASR
ncbi:MAG: hypothetical protein ACRD1X_00600 [Vicinamibacteria bacterium]